MAALIQAPTTSALLCPALLAASSSAPAPPLPGWTRPQSAPAAPTGPIPSGTTDYPGFAAAAALRADLLGRYLLDRDCDPDRRAWALAHMRRTPLISALAAVSAVYRFSSHSWATNIDVPTAVIIPSRDRIISPAHQDKLAAAIPAAVTYNLDADHGVFLTDPDPSGRAARYLPPRQRSHTYRGHPGSTGHRVLTESIICRPARRCRSARARARCRSGSSRLAGGGTCQ